MNKYKLIIFIVIITLILGFGIAFFWNETINLQLKINDQKVANYFITLFTIFGTITTLYVSYKQYDLARIANLSSIKPDLFIKPTSIKMDDFESNDELLGLVRITCASVIGNNMGIEVENKGLGTAKNINYKWIYDKDSVEELIKGFYELTANVEYRCIYYIKPGSVESIKLPHEYFSCYGAKSIERFEEKVLTNIPMSKTEFLIRNDLNKRVYLNYLEETFPKVRPSLVLEITYTDVQDNKYSKSFSASIIGSNSLLLINFSPIL